MAWKKLYIKPNKSAQKAAKRGLEARAKAPKSKKGGLDAMQAYEMGVGSGVLRARDIVAGKRVNAYQVNAFFNRHRQNYINAKLKGLKPEESKAIQAWLLWGGEPLRKQVARAVEKDKAERNPGIAEMLGYKKNRMTKVRFPTPEDSPVGGESMWVEVIRGDENEGFGILKNQPEFFELADYGDMVQFSGGTDRLKPEFESVVECKPIPRAERNPVFDDVPDNVKDPMLYRKARAKVKGRVSVWPSAYASGQLVQEYKRMGGEYINPKKRKKKQDETRAQEARRLLGLRAPAMTGGGLHTDKKKEASRKGARRKIKASDYE